MRLSAAARTSLLALAACGEPFVASGAEPSLRSIQPSTLTAGGPGFTLRVSGQDFTPITRILWNGTPLATLFESQSALEAAVPRGQLTSHGTVAIAVTRTDGKPTAALTLTINPPLIWITGAILSPAPHGQFHAQAFAVAGGTPPVRYTLASGSIPPGLHFDGYNGAVVGYATQPGSFDFSVLATDATGATALQTLRLPVAAELQVVSGVALPPALAGQPYSTQLAATGGAEPYTEWKIVAGALPPGLTLDQKTGRIAGIPISPAGQTQFSVTVRDSAGKLASGAFLLTVRTPLTIAAADAATDFAEGDRLDLKLAATGGEAPFHWTLASGSLPPGIAFDAATASLRGEFQRTGNYQLGFRVRDAGGAEAASPIQLQVAPRLQLNLPPSLPVFVTGSPASFALSAAGGSPPYAFRIVSGALPVGISLTATGGRIEGTPRNEGDSEAIVEVRDRASRTARQAILISVSPAPLPALTLAPLNGLQPGQQAKLDLRLDRAHPSALDVVVQLGFDGPADPAVLLSNGSRTARLTIPAGQLSPATPLLLQTGTTAGVLTLDARLESAGRAVSARQSIVLSSTPPRIRSIAVRKTAEGFEIALSAFSPTRQFEQARFVFDDTIELALPIDGVTGAWYASDISTAFGTSLVYRQNFTVRGDISRLRGVSVSLTNSVGASPPVSAAF